MVFACKKCKRVFRKNIEEFEEADEHCPHCDNHFMPEAKTPEMSGKLVFGFKMEKGHEHKMVLDDREKDRKKVMDESVNWGDDSDERDEDFKCGPDKC